MKIDLSKTEGEPQSFSEIVNLDGERLDPTRTAGPFEVRLKGTVRPVGDGFFVDGRTVGGGPLSCGRCLEPVDWEMDAALSFEIALAPAAPLDPELALDEADLDVVYLEEPILDLEKLAVEQLLLELPMRVLCSDECAGLCPQCGANRNVEDACRCEPEVDPRWAALSDLTGGTPAD